MKLVFAIAKGVIRDATMRRKVMGGCVLAACAMVLAGSTFLAQPLRDSPWLFLIFWAACAWVTVTSILLAIFDLLVVRAAARHERERLRKEVFGGGDKRDEN